MQFYTFEVIENGNKAQLVEMAEKLEVAHQIERNSKGDVRIKNSEIRAIVMTEQERRKSLGHTEILQIQPVQVVAVETQAEAQTVVAVLEPEAEAKPANTATKEPKSQDFVLLGGEIKPIKADSNMLQFINRLKQSSATIDALIQSSDLAERPIDKARKDAILRLKRINQKGYGIKKEGDLISFI